MRSTKATALTLAEKCKNILASNWQAQLNTIKADAKGRYPTCVLSTFAD
uniref:Uncharacterized protein n=1 Tax=Rhizophora mucronata TaxID=61149 RepID=A0A2P2K9Z8_RHIMU